MIHEYILVPLCAALFCSCVQRLEAENRSASRLNSTSNQQSLVVNSTATHACLMTPTPKRAAKVSAIAPASIILKERQLFFQIFFAVSYLSWFGYHNRREGRKETAPVIIKVLDLGHGDAR